MTQQTSTFAANSRARRIALTLIGVGLAVLLSPFALRWIVRQQVAPVTYSVTTAPPYPTALVLGAGLWSDGTVTPMLRNRVSTAIALYRAGRVERLIMSGDAAAPEGDETAAMRQLALDAGVPDSAIVVDGSGVRTFESCARARDVYGEQAVIVVTSGFHLARAVYLCQGLGLDAAGVAPAVESASWWMQAEWEAREVFATLLAWRDLNG
jgi:SanA protein